MENISKDMKVRSYQSILGCCALAGEASGEVREDRKEDKTSAEHRLEVLQNKNISPIAC